MPAELIQLHTSDGLTHSGAFYPPQGNTKELGVIFVHGMTGSFVGEIESVVPGLIALAGYATLCANNRGYGYKGAATEEFAGCIPDIRAAIDFMEERGYSRIALIGHSKGGVKVAYYLTQTQDERVAMLGLLSPADNVHGIPYWVTPLIGKNDVESFMEELDTVIESGQEEKMYILPEWPYFISARTLLDHYRTRDDDVLPQIPGFKLPLLAVCGGQETDWCTTVTMLQKTPPANARVLIIPEADHVYTGKEMILAQVIIDWLGGSNS
ncbi:MAG: alpha/beta fold hydrolase [Anaerolineales bacterium]|nr:alpha/beta fold hydrolase [Anaerolineales bacterium]